MRTAAFLILLISLSSAALADNQGAMYQKGLSDRAAWEAWFNSLQGDFKTGALYWAGQRALSHPGSCQQMNQEFTAGCNGAKSRLDASDALRRSQPDYKLGWNAWAPSAQGTLQPRSWLELRQGTKAYTGDNGESENTLTVCPTANAYKTWSASITAVVPACRGRPSGVPVTIASDEIMSSGVSGYYIVFIKSDDGSWSGWTGSPWLQPRIPVGTKVVVKKPGAETWFLPDRTSVVGHIVLTDGTTLQILAQDPKGNRPDLYAQIIGNSRDAGKKGWVHRLGGWGLNVEGDWQLSFVPPNGAPPPTDAAAAKPDSAGGRIVNKPVWACPSIEVLKKLTRVAAETDSKDRTYLSLKAHFDWGCELFVEGDEVFITDVSGPFSQVHHKADTRDFWTLGSLLD